MPRCTTSHRATTVARARVAAERAVRARFAASGVALADGRRVTLDELRRAAPALLGVSLSLAAAREQLEVMMTCHDVP